jgi:hypothetical protein
VVNEKKDHGEMDSDDVLLACDGESSPEFKKEMGRKSVLLILFLPDDVPVKFSRHRKQFERLWELTHGILVQTRFRQMMPHRRNLGHCSNRGIWSAIQLQSFKTDLIVRIE